MSINRCEVCPIKCCIDFKLTEEIKDPQKLATTLKNFPYIHKTGTALILDDRGKERVVGVYNCNRFDRASGTCIGYDTDPRPEFCENTGVTSIPRKECILQEDSA